MAAEVDLDLGRQPAKAGRVGREVDEGGLGVAHLGRDRRHPRLGRGRPEQADASGVPGERTVGERVDDVDRDAGRLGAHGSGRRAIAKVLANV